MDKTFKKLELLRTKYIPANDVVSLQAIDADEKQLRTLLAQKNFADSDIAKQIVSDAEKRRSEINELLLHDETLNEVGSEAKRQSLFRQRDVWQFLIDRFSVDSVKENIERKINEVDKDMAEIGITDATIAD